MNEKESITKYFGKTQTGSYKHEFIIFHKSSMNQHIELLYQKYYF